SLTMSVCSNRARSDRKSPVSEWKASRVPGQACERDAALTDFRARAAASASEHVPGGSRKGGLVRPSTSHPRKQKATSIFDADDEMNDLHIYQYYSFPMHASDLCSSCEA